MKLTKEQKEQIKDITKWLNRSRYIHCIGQTERGDKIILEVSPDTYSFLKNAKQDMAYLLRLIEGHDD